MKISKCRILRLSHSGQLKFYHVEITYQDGHVVRGLSIPFNDMEGKNEIRRYPSINKVRDWLNTNEGLIYLNCRFKHYRNQPRLEI